MPVNKHNTECPDCGRAFGAGSSKMLWKLVALHTRLEHQHTEITMRAIPEPMNAKNYKSCKDMKQAMKVRKLMIKGTEKPNTKSTE